MHRARIVLTPLKFLAGHRAVVFGQTGPIDKVGDQYGLSAPAQDINACVDGWQERPEFVAWKSSKQLLRLPQHEARRGLPQSCRYPSADNLSAIRNAFTSKNVFAGHLYRPPTKDPDNRSAALFCAAARHAHSSSFLFDSSPLSGCGGWGCEVPADLVSRIIFLVFHLRRRWWTWFAHFHWNGAANFE